MARKDLVFDKDTVNSFVDTVAKAQNDGTVPVRSYPFLEPLSKEHTIGSEAYYVRAILDITANVALAETSEESMKDRFSKLSFYGVARDLVTDFLELVKKKHRSTFTGSTVFFLIYIAIYGALIVNWAIQLVNARPGMIYIPGGLFWGMSLGLTGVLTGMSQLWKRNKLLTKTAPEELCETFAGDVIIQRLKENAEKENPSLFQKNATVRRFIMEVSDQAESPDLSGMGKGQSLGEHTTEALTQLYYSTNSKVRQKIIQIIQTEQEKQRHVSMDQA